MRNLTALLVNKFYYAKGGGRFLWNRPAALAIRRLLQDLRPDVAHVHNAYHQLSPSVLRELARAGIPIALTLHDYKLVCPSYTLLRAGTPCERCAGMRFANAARGRCVRDSLTASMVCALELSLHRTLRLYERYVDVFISPSRFLVETVERMGFRPADFRVIPGSTDLVYEEPLSMGDDAPLLFIGALRKEKGVELLLDAIRATGARLQIAGEGVERGFLEQLARTLGIADKVEFLGGCDRERLRMLLGGCMAVVVPSVWYENFPTVALEALACARPVVASRIGGIPEIVDDGINGILVEPGNSSELAGAIDRLRESRSLVRDMGTAGRDKALVEYAPSVYLDRIEAVFRDMCAGRRARA